MRERIGLLNLHVNDSSEKDKKIEELDREVKNKDCNKDVIEENLMLKKYMMELQREIAICQMCSCICTPE